MKKTTLGRCLLAASLVMLCNHHNVAYAQLRLNPFAEDVQAPPPLVAPSSTDVPIPDAYPPPIAQRFSKPQLQMPQLSLPQIRMPQVSLPQMRMPELSLPQFTLPRMDVPQLPSWQDGTPGVMQQIQRGQERFMKTARAPFEGSSTRSKFLPQVRSATLKKMPKLSVPQLQVPKVGSMTAQAERPPAKVRKQDDGLPQEQPDTVTGWLSQPRPE